jgi:hypothetical protein
MELKLIRETFTEKSTIGSLYVNGIFFCYTLEDKDRKLESGGVKEYAKTAIPRGKYKVINSFSNRFKKYLPELVNVPQFAGIRIHAGNKAEDSEGCILVGATKAVDFIGQSQVTFGKLMKAIQAVEKIERINITIE